MDYQGDYQGGGGGGGGVPSNGLLRRRLGRLLGVASQGL
jgi:hypothetical protein